MKSTEEILRDWIAVENSPWSYVYDDKDLSSVGLDGDFDLFSLINKVRRDELLAIKEKLEKLMVNTPEEVVQMDKHLDSTTQKHAYQQALGFEEAINYVSAQIKEEVEKIWQSE